MTNLAFRTTCSICGRPHAIAFPEYRGEAHCPRCSRRLALERLSATHLDDLLHPVIVNWAKHWRAAGLQEEQLATTLEVFGDSFNADGARCETFRDAQSAVTWALAEPEPLEVPDLDPLRQEFSAVDCAVVRAVRWMQGNVQRLVLREASGATTELEWYPGKDHTLIVLGADALLIITEIADHAGLGVRPDSRMILVPAEHLPAIRHALAHAPWKVSDEERAARWAEQDRHESAAD